MPTNIHLTDGRSVISVEEEPAKVRSKLSDDLRGREAFTPLTECGTGAPVWISAIAVAFLRPLPR